MAQRAAPESRVVCADHDPVVIGHSPALLAGSPQGRTAVVHADLRDTTAIITQAARTLDFTRPVAVMFIALLHFIADPGDSHAVVGRLMDAMPAGSFLVPGHAASDIAAEPAFRDTARQHERSRCPRRADPVNWRR